MITRLSVMFASLWIAGACIAATHREDRRPNIVVILADDLGAHDLGCTGSDYHETPHLDRMAREGLRFARAYAAAPVCSPTRAALLTGRSPARLGITIWAEGSRGGPKDRPLIQAESRHDLPHSEQTLATVLGRAGYLTALVGKWHLGDADHAPETHGFDVNIGGTRWGAPQTFFWPYRGRGRFAGEFRYVPHLEFGRPGEYLTDRLTDEAIRVIDRGVAEGRPFFLYFAHHAPHTPIEGKPELVERYRKRLRPGSVHRNPAYAAMVHSLDESVGRVLARLDHHEIGGETWVIFTSDNGGYIGSAEFEGRAIPVTSNHPLRSGKGTCYEGGLRVPLIVRAPGAAVGKVCEEPVVTTDLFPTILRAAGCATPEGVELDGEVLTPLLTDPEARLGRDSIAFHYPHYYHAPISTPVGALVSRKWKLLEFFESGRLELYDLASDPGESVDQARSSPERVESMRLELADRRARVGARMPTPNPAAVRRIEGSTP
ncbi:MAG: sulfatase [Isosphaeraceae bacterium]|nr:sulfatase [Isosphaeraceae bacterium]